MSESAEYPLDELTVHSDRLHALVRRLLRDESLVEDIVQETFLAALSRPLARIRDVPAFLSQVARHKVADALRRERARPVADDHPADLPDVEEAFEREELRQRVVEEVRRLDEPYRQVVTQRYLNGLSPRRIARQMGVPPATVRTWLHRGRETLRERFKRQELHGVSVWLLLPLLVRPRWMAAGPASSGALRLLAGGLLIAAVGVALGGRALFTGGPSPGGALEAGGAVAASEAPAPPAVESPGTRGEDGGRSTVAPTAAPPRLGGRLVLGYLHQREPTIRAGVALLLTLYRGHGTGGEILGQEAVGSDPDGSFHWPRDLPSETVTLAVALYTNGYGFHDLATTTLTAIRGEVPAPLDLGVFPLDLPLEVVVRDPHGFPLEGAFVRSRGDSGWTDANGSVWLRSSTDYPAAKIWARAEGYAEGHVTSGSGRIELQLGLELVIEGRVLEKGSGLPLAGVPLSADAGPGAVTDAAGRFVLTHLDAGKAVHRVRAEWEGFVPGSKKVRTEGRRIPEVVLELSRGLEREDLVVDGAGEPVEGAALTCGRSLSDVDRLEAVTGADGRWVFRGLGDRPAELLTTRPGFAADLRPFDPRETSTMVVVLGPGDELWGRVAGRDGEPVPGARVLGSRGHDWNLAETRTDAQGAFRLERLAAAADTLLVHAANLVPVQVPLDDFTPGETRVLDQAHGVGGTVVGAGTGKPLACTVRFVDRPLEPDERRSTGYSSTWKDTGRSFPTGSWELPSWCLRPGVLHVEATAPGHWPKVVRYDVGTEPGLGQAVIELEPQDPFAGYVESLPGSPVVDAQVSLVPADGSGAGPGAVATDARGRFQFAFVRPGTWYVVASHPEWAYAVKGPFEVQPAKAMPQPLLRLSAGARQEVRFEDEHGSPRAGLDAELLPHAPGLGVPRSARTDLNGLAAFECVRPGPHRVRLRERAGGLKAVVFSADIDVGETAGESVTLRPAGDTTLFLSVASAHVTPGAPADFAVELFPLDAPSLPIRGGIARGGRLEITALAAGTYEVVASGPGPVAGSRLRGTRRLVVPAGIPTLHEDVRVEPD